MKTSILIPYMNGDSYRERDLRLVLGWTLSHIDDDTELVVCEQVTKSEWISKEFPRVIHVVQEGFQKFNKSACWNHGFKHTKGKYIVGLDADIIIDGRWLHSDTVEAYLETSRLVYPFDSIVDTTDSETRGFMASQSFLNDCIDVCNQKDRLRAGTRCYGGIWYMSRKDFVEIGGFNRGFGSWGGEDDVFHWISTAMYTKDNVGRTENHVFHLWHPIQNNTQYLMSDDYNKVVELKQEIMSKHYDTVTAPKYCKVQKYLNGLVAHA